MVLLITAQELHPKGDALVPLPRQEADVSAVERRLEDVLLVDVVVAVAREDLERRRKPTQITNTASLKLKTPTEVLT